MRNHPAPPPQPVALLRHFAKIALHAPSIDSLRGTEGSAAALYFEHFAAMIKTGNDPLDPDLLQQSEISNLKSEISNLKSPISPPPLDFQFRNRNRRPPTDPVNALLSLAYAILAKDCTIALHAVGFDPTLGFYHQIRPGRPSLALDLMEEFRPLIADSTVLTLINNRMISPKNFIRAGKSVNLSPEGRKTFYLAYEQRMNHLIRHPVFDYQVSYRRALEIQARLLAKALVGDIPRYIPFLTR